MRVMEATEHEGTSVVELRRTSGSTLLFLDAFNEVKDAVTA